MEPLTVGDIIGRGCGFCYGDTHVWAHVGDPGFVLCKGTPCKCGATVYRPAKPNVEKIT